jgi:pimeloyl-ACP methyl ester carboxylesterase
MLMVPARLSVLSRMLTPRRYRDPGYAKAVAPALYGGRMRRRPDEARHVLYEQERLGPSAGYFLQLLAGVGWSSLPALPLIRQPTLVLAGNDDPIIPLVNARILHALLPHATLHVFDDGHLGLLTSADELGPIVSRFLICPDGANASGRS